MDSIEKGFIEEQAKARAAQGLPARSSSTRRTEGRPSASRNASANTQAKDGLAKGPDPSEFDADLATGEDSEPSRTGTPAPAKIQDDAAGAAEESDNKQIELPRDVQQKLQKLSKLEFRYQELLRSYRIAHARVTAIEPFEAALRENTPLTSIGDPVAFTEYLSQVNLKGDMVLEELKRVTSEKTESEKTLKNKLKEAEEETRKAHDELTQLKSKQPEVSAEKKDEAESESPAAKSDEMATSVTSPKIGAANSQLDASKSPTLSSRIKMPNFFPVSL